MSEDFKRFRVPEATKKTGWYEVPLWVIDGGVIPYPPNKFTMKDGTIVQPGQWLEDHPDGVRIAAQPVEEK